MTPVQYITTNSDRIELLNQQLQGQKDGDATSQTRCKFEQRPSMRAINQNKTENNLDVKNAGDCYRDLCKAKASEQSPGFEEWLSELANNSKEVEVDIDNAILEALKFTAP